MAPPPIPDPNLLVQGPRPCQVYWHAKDAVVDGLIVIYMDTFEHECYGDVRGAAETVWTAIGEKGRELVARTRYAEQRIHDMERGAQLLVRGEVKARIAERALRPHSPYNLTLEEDRDRLLHDLFD